MNDTSTQTEEDIRQNELLTVREVADYLRVGRVTVWRWCKEGVIPACRVGRSWRIPRDDLLDLLEIAQSPNPNPGQFGTALEDDGRPQILTDCTEDDSAEDSSNN